MKNVITQLTEHLQINFITIGGKGAKHISNNVMGKVDESKKDKKTK